MREIRKLINLTLQIIYAEFWMLGSQWQNKTAKVLVRGRGEKLDTWALNISYVRNIGNPLLNGNV